MESQRLSRSAVTARNGIVAASQPLAVNAGIEILKRGGSAIDAAIATSAVLSVVEPGASHLGGDAFLISYESSSRQTQALNGSGAAPHAAQASEFNRSIPVHGYKAATVPGLVSTWFAAYERGGKLRFTELLAPAIKLAESGFAVTPDFSRRLEAHLRQYPSSTLLAQLGLPKIPQQGEIFKQLDLAHSLRSIATYGRTAFYEGEIAQALITSSGGWFDAHDLREHATEVCPPLTVEYREHLVHCQPPPSQGMILAEELLIAQGFNFDELSEAERIHAMVEAKKIAFEDRYLRLGDPRFLDLDLKSLFSEPEINARMRRIDLARANNTPVRYGQEGSDTTYFLAADRDGNAVSWIQSVFHNFGAAWVIPGTGIVMNNRLTGFVLEPHSPNYIQPGKRPAHTLNAWLVTRRDGTLALVGGTPGANIQVQTNFQLIVNALDLGMEPQANVEAPRWQHLKLAGKSDEVESFDGVLQIEDRVDATTFKALKALGHDVVKLAPFGHGSAVQLLEVTPTGYIAGSDPRAPGLAAGI